MLADDHLDNFTLLRSANVDETRALVADVFCDHRLVPLGAATRIDYRHWHAALPSIGLSLMKYGAHVRVEPREFESFYLVQMPVSGVSSVTCCGSEIQTHPGRASVHSPRGSMTMDWSVDCHKAVVRIDSAALERHLGALLGEQIRAPIAFMPAMDTASGMGATWMRTAKHLMSELQHNPLLAGSAIVVSHLEQLLMSGLIQAQPNLYLERLRKPVRNIAPRHVRLAQEFIRANAHKPISIADLTRLTGVCGRTLYSGFRHFSGDSPMQYLRRIRMENARRDMQCAPPARSVTEIATQWGFYQLGRFATDYKTRFGESPSATRRKADR